MFPLTVRIPPTATVDPLSVIKLSVNALEPDHLEILFAVPDPVRVPPPPLPPISPQVVVYPSNIPNVELYLKRPASGDPGLCAVVPTGK